MGLDGAGGGWLEQLRIRLYQLPTKLKLKLKLSLAKFTANKLSYLMGYIFIGGFQDLAFIKVTDLFSHKLNFNVTFPGILKNQKHHYSHYGHSSHHSNSNLYYKIWS